MNMRLVKYVLWGALRDRLLLTVLLSMAVVAGLSLFLGGAPVVEKSAFSQVFVASGIRLVGILGLILFIVFFIRRCFDAKEIEFMLARPVGRVSFIVSYACGFSLIACFFGLVGGMIVYILSGFELSTGLAVWSISLIAEYIVIANVAFFISMVLGSASAGAMATLGFYVLCRMSGQFLGIADSGLGHGSSAEFASLVFPAFSVFFPRLDLMAQTSWLVYGMDDPSQIVIVLVHTLVFSFFIVLACLIDLIRRQF